MDWYQYFNNVTYDFAPIITKVDLKHTWLSLVLKGQPTLFGPLCTVDYDYEVGQKIDVLKL